jgi:hypothetical protein
VAFFVDRIVNHEHPLIDADLGRGEADPFADFGILLPLGGILAFFEISEHLIEKGFFSPRSGGEPLLWRRSGCDLALSLTMRSITNVL